MIRVRRLLSSLNFLIVLMLLGALFIMVNYLASRRYARWDLTRQQLTALSDHTRQMLAQLKEPVSVIVFYQPDHRLYELVTDALNEYARISPQITIERVDPQQDVARARLLVKEFEIDVSSPDALNLVIFKSGLPASLREAQAGSRHKYLSDTDLAEYDYSSMTMKAEPRVKAFKGEEAFTSAIVSITQAEAPLVWFVSGHGEKSVAQADPYGLSDVKKHLEQQNMSVQEVTLLERASVAPEVKLLVIAGPTRRFTETETVLLQGYLGRGGRLLALIDALDETGLDGLLARWGVELGMDIVVDPSRQLPFGSAANLFVTTYTQHPIVQKMKTLMTLFPLARSVRAVQPTPEQLTVTPLALTSDEGWGEINTSVEAFQFKEGEDLKGPVSIAVASESLDSPAPSDWVRGRSGQAPSEVETARLVPARTRLVVIGDADFIINAQLGNIGNRDFLLGAIYWLLEQEQRIGIGPKTLESLKLNLTAAQLRQVFWFSFLAMPLLCAGLGLGMWWLRRK